MIENLHAGSPGDETGRVAGDAEDDGMSTRAKRTHQTDAPAAGGDAYARVMDVLGAAYDLGMSGDPIEADAAQVRRRLALVNACEAASDAIRALTERAERVEAAIREWRAARDAVFDAGMTDAGEVGDEDAALRVRWEASTRWEDSTAALIAYGAVVAKVSP